MADEHNKNMEKILRAYTEARRKGADLPLHPAARKMLHAEVARRFKNGDREPFWSRLRAFWPQLAFGSGLCAILLVAAISLRHQPQPEQKESGSERQASAVASAAARGGASVARDTELRAESVNEALKKQAPENDNVAPLPKAETMNRRDVAMISPPASAPQPLASAPQRANTPNQLSPKAPQLRTATRTIPEEQEVVKLKDAKVLQEQNKGDLSASSRARVPESRVLQSPEEVPAQQRLAPISASRFASADRLTNLGDALRLQFVRVPTRGQSATTQLLNSFQLEQQGDEVRITDKDGSVYLGQLFPEPPGQATNSASLGELTERGVVVAESFTSVQLLFAQGTNRTLVKPVRLEGRYLERTNPVEVGTVTSAASPAAKAAATPATRLGRGRYSVVGKAIVGQTNEVPLNAVSVEPGK
jgi:hypothetical protein